MIRSSSGEIKFVCNIWHFLFSRKAAKFVAKKTLKVEMLNMPRFSLAVIISLCLWIVFCYMWHTVSSVLLTYLLTVIIKILDRSSRAETVEQKSDGEGSESSEETSDLWTLYKTVRKYTTNLGICLSDPFLRLPSKRFVSALALCRVPTGAEMSYKVTNFIFWFFRPDKCCIRT